MYILKRQTPGVKGREKHHSWRISSSSSSHPESSDLALNAGVPLRREKKASAVHALVPLPRAVEGLSDDPNLHNPLQRQERLGTGWFGVVLEHDGVLFEACTDANTEAWLRVAQELGYHPPLGYLFRYVAGLRDDVVVTSVFRWTQNTQSACRIAGRKARIHEELVAHRADPCADAYPAALSGSAPFLETLKTHNIPVALACGSLGTAEVRERLGRAGLGALVTEVVTGDDGGAAEVEWYFEDAALRIGRPPVRCVLVGSSSASIGVARELGMKCVVITGNRPVYHFASADLVVRDLSHITFSSLKSLFRQEV
jgi:beta-phosphoglucomutase-like phosphatase (HAD superfamily)